MRASFKRMHAVASYFNRDALRREEMRELLDDPGIVASAQRAVTDLAYAQQTFGEDQAMARVYALQLLVEAARQGNNGPMRESIASLTETLDQLARTGQPPQKAQDRDLADLLNAAVAQIGAERLEADLTGTLAELGYRPILAPEVRKLFDDAVFFPLLDRLGRAEASRRVAQALAGDA
jgi:hypothetical protein